MKAKECAEDRYHRMFNHKVESSLHLVPSCSLMGSCMMDTMDYNYKLRSVIGREDDFKANKWTCFDKQVHATFLWSWIISQALVDYTNTRRIIGCILDDVYATCVSMDNSIGTITSYFHTSMVVHPGSNDHL